jgi:hypothetical protein
MDWFQLRSIKMISNNIDRITKDFDPSIWQCSFAEEHNHDECDLGREAKKKVD